MAGIAAVALLAMSGSAASARTVHISQKPRLYLRPVYRDRSFVGIHLEAIKARHPRGSHVEAACRACHGHFRSRSVRHFVAHLSGKLLSPRLVLEIRITKPGLVGRYFGYSHFHFSRLGTRGTARRTERCLRPGSRKPRRSCKGKRSPKKPVTVPVATSGTSPRPCCSPPAPPAGAKELGSVDLKAYCQRRGYDGAELDGPIEGPYAAYNWRCFDSTRTDSIDVQDACRAEYGLPDATAKAADLNDAYSWRCYSRHQPSSSGEVELGSVDLDGYCKSLGYDGAELEGPRYASYAAYNWRCFDSARKDSIDVQGACQYEYSRPDATAHATNVNDAYSWRCYRPSGG